MGWIHIFKNIEAILSGMKGTASMTKKDSSESLVQSKKQMDFKVY